LIAAGYETPLASGRDSGHLVNFIADARYRQREYDFLVQPGDAIWDESTMSANVNFKFDESDLLCDLNTIMSTERLLQYVAKNGIVTEDNIKIFEEFYKIAQYFPSNWYGADSTQAITDFETQTSPLLYQASYNAGLIYSDIKQLPKNQQFEWGTVQLTGFGKTPEGFSETLRGFWDFGNRMSIVYTDDEDHLERIKDFYKFWYSKDGAIMCYEETLNNGNFVQGPCVIKGVELSPELEMLLAGFETAPAKDFSKLLVAGITSADTPLDIDIMTRFTSGKIDAETFLKERTAVSEASLADQIARSGYDLDPTTKDTPAK
jgi:hypothetical protein